MRILTLMTIVCCATALPTKRTLENVLIQKGLECKESMKTKLNAIFGIFRDDREPKQTEIYKDYDHKAITAADVSLNHYDLEKAGHKGNDFVTVEVHNDNEQPLVIDSDKKDKPLKAEIYKDDNEFLVEDGNENKTPLRTEIYWGPVFERDDDDLYDGKKYRIHNPNGPDDDDLYRGRRFKIRNPNGPDDDDLYEGKKYQTVDPDDPDDGDDGLIKGNDVHVYHVSAGDVVIVHDTLELKEKN